jgi:hypothetical protein
MARDIHIRRAACLEQLRRLEERLATIQGADPQAPFMRISLRIQHFQWQAELGVLDEIEREVTFAATTLTATPARVPEVNSRRDGRKAVAAGAKQSRLT